MNTTPQSVIATPGVGMSIDVIGWSVEEQISLNGGTAFSSGPTFSLRFNGIAVDLVAGFTVSNPGAGSRYLRATFQPGAATTQGTDVSTANKAVMLRTAADITGGSNATINFTFKIYYALRAVSQ
jgi:hypothetical protein